MRRERLLSLTEAFRSPIAVLKTCEKQCSWPGFVRYVVPCTSYKLLKVKMESVSRSYVITLIYPNSQHPEAIFPIRENPCAQLRPALRARRPGATLAALEVRGERERRRQLRGQHAARSVRARLRAVLRADLAPQTFSIHF